MSFDSLLGDTTNFCLLVYVKLKEFSEDDELERLATAGLFWRSGVDVDASRSLMFKLALSLKVRKWRLVDITQIAAFLQTADIF
jgi:hypothetical protein